MRTLIVLTCVFGMALCVPVTPKDTQPSAVPTPIQASTRDQAELARKRRTLDIDFISFNGGNNKYFTKVFLKILIYLTISTKH